PLPGAAPQAPAAFSPPGTAPRPLPAGATSPSPPQPVPPQPAPPAAAVNPADLPSIRSVPALPAPRWPQLVAWLGVWLPVLLPLLAFPLPLPITFADEYGSLHGLDKYLVVWLLGVPVLIAISVASVIWLSRLRRWRWPADAMVYARWPGWLAVLSAPFLVLGVVVTGLLLEMLRGVTWSTSEDVAHPASSPYYRQGALERIAEKHTELIVVLVIGVLIALVGCVGILICRRWTHPRLAILTSGLQYEAAPDRGMFLPWSQLKHVEIRSPGPGQPDAVLAWPTPDTPSDPRLAPLWSRDVNGYLVPALRQRFAAAPDDVAYAIAEQSGGKVMPGRAR
ncbi:MAG: hypothetical protein ACRDT4_22005, partial [Micromonosporaceae bacterium]